MNTVLLDSNNLAMRSYHAAKNRMTSADGIETGSLHLFMRSLAMHLAELRPTHFVAVWDGGASVYRDLIFSGYKGARRAKSSPGPAPHARTFVLIQEFLSLVGLAQWRYEGFEADDVIAQAAIDSQGPVTIMSSDKDLLQLLTRDDITQIRFSSGHTETDTWDRQRVIADMGYEPEKIPLVMALTGDPGDSVPGARGIGPVKALRLLTNYGWDLQKAAATVPDEADVLMSYLLVKLPATGLSLPPVPEYTPISLADPEDKWQAVADFCTRYEFQVLWDDLVEGRLLAQGSPR